MRGMNRLVMTMFGMLLLALLASGTSEAQSKRLALVIGNEAYSGDWQRLNNPHNDAAAVGNALSATGFAVNPRYDLGRGQILAEVQALADQLRIAGPDAIGFFYYSGHGGSATVGSRRRNYLIPTGAAITRADHLLAEGVALEDIVAILEGAGAKAVFIVFDACRNELPWSKGGADPDKAFGAVSARPGVFIAYATDAGATAPDDGAYARALADQLVRPNLPHVLAFDAVGLSVAKSRGTDRLPWYTNQVSEQIYFAGGVFAPSPTSIVAPASAPSVQLSVDHLQLCGNLRDAAHRLAAGTANYLKPFGASFENAFVGIEVLAMGERRGYAFATRERSFTEVSVTFDGVDKASVEAWLVGCRQQLTADFTAQGKTSMIEAMPTGTGFRVVDQGRSVWIGPATASESYVVAEGRRVYGARIILSVDR